METSTPKIKLPEGVKSLADIGHGMIIAEVPLKLFREQDRNAHLMKPEMFRQLSENIKKRGQVESLPFSALTDKGIEIVSGHHRVRAAKEAGLKSIPTILDITGLNRSRIAAKQIAHNAINGFDDRTVLREIAKMIKDVDDMIESYIGKDVLEEADGELEKLLAPILKFEWQDIQFVFLPHQMNDLKKLVEKLDGNKDYMGAAHIDQYESFVEVLSRYQKFSNIKNIGAAIHRLIETARKNLEGVEDLDTSEWVPLSSVFGNVTFPKETASKLTAVMSEMIENNVIPENQKWKVIDKLIESYGTKD